MTAARALLAVSGNTIREHVDGAGGAEVGLGGVEALAGTAEIALGETNRRGVRIGGARGAGQAVEALGFDETTNPLVGVRIVGVLGAGGVAWLVRGGLEVARLAGSVEGEGADILGGGVDHLLEVAQGEIMVGFTFDFLGDADVASGVEGASGVLKGAGLVGGLALENDLGGGHGRREEEEANFCSSRRSAESAEFGDAPKFKGRQARMVEGGIAFPGFELRKKEQGEPHKDNENEQHKRQPIVKQIVRTNRSLKKNGGRTIVRQRSATGKRAKHEDQQGASVTFVSPPTRTFSSNKPIRLASSFGLAS